jgi:hypothetical protein
MQVFSWDCCLDTSVSCFLCSQKLDRADTAYAERAHELSLKNRNGLRHGKGTTAEKIDEMFLDGATIEQIAKIAKTTKAAVSVV